MAASRGRIGVALSGSGFLFPCHVGALKAIADYGFTISEISGTSGGGIIASLCATGMDLKTMEDLTLNQDWSSMMSVRWWGWWNGICKGGPILDWLKAHTDNKTFAETTIPLSLMTTNITTGMGEVFSSKTTPEVPVALIARASSSIPFIYPSVQVGMALFVDGGVVDNEPVNLLTEVNKIGVEILPSTSILNGNPSWLELAKRTIEILMSSNEDVIVKSARLSGIPIVGVPRSPWSTLDRNISPEDRAVLMKRGYDNTMETLQEKFPSQSKKKGKK